MLNIAYQLIRTIILVAMISAAISCTGNKKTQENDNTTIEEESVNSDQIEEKHVSSYKINEPPEFANNKWRSMFGELAPKENNSLEDLQNCSWHSGATYLNFSKEGNYALGESWTGPQYGIYELNDNVISLYPPFQYFIASVKYQIDKLYYSNEIHYSGAPVLKNIDENLEFYPYNYATPELGETIRINRYYCEKIWEETRIIKNKTLYALPDISSINIFENGYYGDRSMEANVAKLARLTIDGIVWYYIIVDFTTEPIDGGGPFFNRWLAEEYFA